MYNTVVQYKFSMFFACNNFYPKKHNNYLSEGGGGKGKGDMKKIIKWDQHDLTDFGSDLEVHVYEKIRV